MGFSRLQWLAAITKRGTLATICLFLGGCGFWALLGAGLIFFRDDPTVGFAVIGASFVAFGLACLATSIGLWKNCGWARQAIMALSVTMLGADIAAVFIQDASLEVRDLLLLFPLAFVCFIFRYFSKPDIKALYARR